MDSLFNASLSLEQLLPLMREYLDAGRCVTFSPKGTSMLPMIREGRDTVTISPLPAKMKMYDLPLYRRDDGQFVLHRIVEVGDTYTCMGDNQFVREYGVRQDQLIGLVTRFRRDGKEYAVTDLRYRLYCFVWHHSRQLRFLLKRVRSWLRRKIV